jgi:CO/xanthine dehydrogenase FAD-binding subunit
LIGNICNASPAGDTICAALLYEGFLIIQTAKGEREESLDSFFQGPGKTTLKPGEIVSAIQLPPSPANQQTSYLKLGRNRAGDLSVVGVGVIGYPDGTTASGIRFRIALASVAPVTLRATQAETILSSAPINDQLIKKACSEVRDACHPIDDVRASAEYRKEMAYNLTLQAVTDIYHRLQTINS